MDQNILVLDDEQVRHNAFKAKFSTDNFLKSVTTAKAAIEELQTRKWSIFFIDHDLGTKLSGYDVAKWIYNNKKHLPKTIIIHSMNPVGAKNIIGLLPQALYHPGIWLK